MEFVTGALLIDLGVERNHNEPPDLIEKCRLEYYFNERILKN